MVTNVVTWRGIGKRTTANSLRISGLLWCHQESNRGHKDFQSFALPTELWHLVGWPFVWPWLALLFRARPFWFCVAKVGSLFGLCKCLGIFFAVWGGFFNFGVFFSLIYYLCRVWIGVFV